MAGLWLVACGLALLAGLWLVACWAGSFGWLFWLALLAGLWLVGLALLAGLWLVGWLALILGRMNRTITAYETLALLVSQEWSGDGYWNVYETLLTHWAGWAGFSWLRGSLAE